MGRGGGRSGGGGGSRSSHSSSRGVTSGRSGGYGRSSGGGMSRAGGFSRSSSGSSGTHRGGAGWGGPGKRTTSGSGGLGSARRASYGGGYGGPTPPPPRRPHYGGWRRTFGGPVFGGPVYGGGSYAGASGGCGGCLTTLIVLVVVLTILSILMPVSCASLSFIPDSGSQTTTSQVAQVTHTHKKLSASECDAKDVWIDDRADWLDDERTVVKALQYFYDKTGSQPYLVVATDVEGKTEFTDAEGEAWANAIYDQQFSDDGHTVVAFVEYADSEYAYYIIAGRAAQSVIDDEARNIIADEINYWYTDPSLDDSAYFAKVFTESADTIMFDYEQTTKTTHSRRRIVVLALGVAGAAAVIGLVVSRTSKRKKEEYEAAQRLAETPVAPSGYGTDGTTQASAAGTDAAASTAVPSSSELEEFERKYGSDDPS